MRNSVQVFGKKNERVENQIWEQAAQRGCQISIVRNVQNRWTRPLNNKYVWICLNLTRWPVIIPFKLNWCLWHQTCNKKKLHLAIIASFFKYSRTAFHVYQTQLYPLYFSYINHQICSCEMKCFCTKRKLSSVPAFPVWQQCSPITFECNSLLGNMNLSNQRARKPVF